MNLVGTTGSCWEGEQEKQKYLGLSPSMRVFSAPQDITGFLFDRGGWELGKLRNTWGAVGEVLGVFRGILPEMEEHGVLGR